MYLQYWNLRLDEPAWIREGSGSEAALADRSRAEAAAVAVRLMMEVEEEDRRTVPSLGDPSRAAVAAAAGPLSPRPLPPTARMPPASTRSNPPAAAAPSTPYLKRRERAARAELDKRLSDVTPPPEDDDARFRAAAEKIMKRRPILDSRLKCSRCGEDLEGRKMLLKVLELPADLRTDRLMTAASKFLDEHPAPLP
ncbi:uncharacterized protein [Triticum aestivum]|uniref:uncharacterized protein n=1 Tax=Triticum aestivum TaxID=4565 RepID=UPI001D004D79|nr:uncharacterized protein LOC123158419 [Triticum aestivum]